MGLVYGIQHFHDLKWMGDNNMEKCKSLWYDIVNLQSTPLENDHLAELLLNRMKESKVMAPDIALYRKDVYSNGGEGNYEALLSILIVIFLCIGKR